MNATAALLLLWAAPSFPGDAGVPRPFRWEVPQALENVAVSEPVQALGVPMRLRAVRSREGVEDLFRYFLAAFQKADLYVPPRENQFQVPGGLQLTGLDIHTHISYTVIFQPNPDHTTTVILGEGDLANRRSPESDRAGVPVYPGAQDVLKVSHEGSTTVTYSVAASAADLARFYRRTMGPAGFREVEGMFIRPGEEVQILAQGEADGGASFVTVLQRRQAFPARVPEKAGSSAPTGR